MPSRAGVSGFFTTFTFSRPGMVNRPALFRLFLMTPCNESNTLATSFRDSFVSLQIWATISDFVGALAILELLGSENCAGKPAFFVSAGETYHKRARKSPAIFFVSGPLVPEFETARNSCENEASRLGDSIRTARVCSYAHHVCSSDSRRENFASPCALASSAANAR